MKSDNPDANTIPNPWSLVRVVVMLEAAGGRWELMSHPLDPVMADILQRNLCTGPVRALSSKIIPAEQHKE